MQVCVLQSICWDTSGVGALLSLLKVERVSKTCWSLTVCLTLYNTELQEALHECDV